MCVCVYIYIERERERESQEMGTSNESFLNKMWDKTWLCSNTTTKNLEDCSIIKNRKQKIANLFQTSMNSIY